MVVVLGRWCEPFVADPRTDVVDAWLASSPGVAGLDRARAGGTPVGVMDGSAVRVGTEEAVPFPPEGLDVGTRLAVTFGSQVQYDSYSGAGVQPTVRALWKALPHQRVWAATSRALRTPYPLSRRISVRLEMPNISAARSRRPAA